MLRHSLLTRLNELADPAYREFAMRLIPGENRMLGVRLPALRRLAQAHARAHGLTLLSEPAGADATFEEILLRAMLPAYANGISTAERLRYLQQEQPNLNNWSLCDSTCATCHFVREHQDEVFCWLQPYLHSEQEFAARFGVVMLNNYYAADPARAPIVIEALRHVPQAAYYAAMAVAWCACTLLTSRIDLRDEVGQELLTPGYLPEQTRKLLLRKLRETQKKWSRDKIY